MPAGTDGQPAEDSPKDYEQILRAVAERFPGAVIVLTVGEDGVLYQDGDQRASHGSYRVKAVDTTAAGDTFCGYFLAGLAKGLSVEERLELASKASALAVSVKGAANSIPIWDEAVAFTQ